MAWMRAILALCLLLLCANALEDNDVTSMPPLTIYTTMKDTTPCAYQPNTRHSWISFSRWVQTIRENQLQAQVLRKIAQRYYDQGTLAPEFIHCPLPVVEDDLKCSQDSVTPSDIAYLELIDPPYGLYDTGICLNYWRDLAFERPENYGAFDNVLFVHDYHKFNVQMLNETALLPRINSHGEHNIARDSDIVHEEYTAPMQALPSTRGILSPYDEAAVRPFVAPAPFYCDISYLGKQETLFARFTATHPGDEYYVYGFYMAHVTAIPYAHLYRIRHEPLRVFDCKRWFPISNLYLPHYVKASVPTSLAQVRRVVHVDRALLVASQRIILAYYHQFLNEVVETMLVTLPALMKEFPDIKVLHNYPVTGGAAVENYFLKSWLELIGFDLKNVIYVDLDPTTLYDFDMLYVPSPSHSVKFSPGVIQLARLRIFDLIPGLYQTTHERLAAEPDSQLTVVVIKRTFTGAHPGRYRSDAVPRSLINHDALMDALRQNFPDETFVEFGRVDSPVETAHIFNKAKVVIAPMGAGLANMIFSMSDTFLVEILNSNDSFSPNLSLASALGIGYIGMEAPNSSFAAPMSAPIEAVLNNVGLALSGFETNHALGPVL